MCVGGGGGGGGQGERNWADVGAREGEGGVAL